MNDTITTEFRALSRRLETARALLQYWCGQGSYRRVLFAASNALDAVSTAQLEFEGEDDGLIDDALERARAAVGNVELLADVEWRGKLSPSVN